MKTKTKEAGIRGTGNDVRGRWRCRAYLLTYLLNCAWRTFLSMWTRQCLL